MIDRSHADYKKNTLPTNSPPTESFIDNVEVQETEVLKLLKNVKPHKGSGSDGISTRFLRDNAPAPTLLYKNSLKQGIVPQEWLRASVIHVYKGGKKDRSSVENYRPTRLLQFAAKSWST